MSITMYRYRDDGSKEYKTISIGMFSSADDYIEAVDYAFSIGFEEV